MTRPTIAPPPTDSRNVSWGDEPGGMIVGAIAYDVTFQGTVYGSEPPIPATWSNGNPKMVRAITLVTESSNLADTNNVDIGPGDIVTLYLNSYTDQKAYRAAAKAHATEINVGDRVKAEFTELDGRTKVKTFWFTSVDENDALVAEAVDEYERRVKAEQARIDVPAQPRTSAQSKPAQSKPAPIEEPF